MPVAQTFGAKEYSLMRRYVVNAMALAAGISIAFAVVTALFCRTDPGSDPHAGEYFRRRVPVSDHYLYRDSIYGSL
ncbi:MAG: hypothetical protein ACLTSZ_02885 [Lachnospiraceae bacterium]